MGAVGDRAHRFRYRLVLQRNGRDAGERVGPLQFAVLVVVVVPVRLRTPAAHAIGGCGFVLADHRAGARPPRPALLERLHGVPADRPHHRVVVVLGHPDVAGHQPVRAAGEERVEREEEVAHAPVGGRCAVLGLPGIDVAVPPAVHHAVPRGHDVEEGRVLLPPGVDGVRPALQHAVQEPGMARVDVALEGLHPVAAAVEGRHLPLLRRHVHPLEVRERRRLCARPHVRPDHTGCLLARVGRRPDLLLERAHLRLVRHVDAAARDVELPPVVDAAQAVVLVPAEVERRPAVRAALRKQAHASGRVPEDDEILAQQAHPHRVAVGFGKLLGQHDRDPITAHEVPHRRPRRDVGHQFVLFNAQHVGLPC